MGIHPATSHERPAAILAGTLPPQSWRSRFGLAWIGRLVWKVHLGKLRESDWPRLHPEFTSENLSSKALDLWQKQVQNGTARRLGVRRVLWGLTGGRFVLGMLAAMLRGMLEQGLLPLLVREVIVLAGEGSFHIWRTMVLVLLIFICRVFENLAESLSWTLVLEHSLTVSSAAASALVLHKWDSVLTTTPEADGLSPQCLLGVDIPKLLGRTQLIVMAMQSTSGFVTGIVTSFYLIGVVAASVGLAWVIFLILFATKLRGLQTSNERPMVEVTSERIKVLSTLLSTVKGVKLFAWEDQYFDVLSRLRKKELRYIWKYNVWWFMGGTVGKAVPITTPLICFSVFALMGSEMTVADVFAANTVFIQLRRNVDLIAIGIMLYKTFQLTLERIQRYMDLPERQPRLALTRDTPEDPLAKLANAQIIYESREQRGKAQDPSACESKDLVDINVDPAFSLTVDGDGVVVRPGDFVAVCGCVGQGKSTLLGALANALSDACSIQGAQAEAACAGDVALVPQKAFVISGTVLENLCMGLPLAGRETELCKVLAGCELVADLKALEHGLEEEVGERGTTLSGGQQARVNLARALFRAPELLVVDDVFAAVDAKVALTLFKTIRSFVREDRARRAAVVALNQTYLLNNFDHIIFLCDGHVAGQGSYEELLASCPKFAEFVADIAPVIVADAAAEEQRQLVQLSKQCEDFLSASCNSRASVKGHLLKDEGLKEGNEINVGAWLQYFRLARLDLVGCSILTEALIWTAQGGRDWWLSIWSEAGDANDNALFYIGIYASLCMAQLLLHLVIAFMVVDACCRACYRLHHTGLARLLGAPVGYFEETPQGRLLSRFGTDLAQLDTQSSVYLESAVQFVFMLMMFVTVISLKVPWMFPAFVVASLSFWVPCKAGVRARVAAQRHSNASMGPLFSNLVELTYGRPLIRAMNSYYFFFNRHCQFQDDRTRFHIVASATMNFGRMVVDCSNVVLTSGVAISLLATNVDSADAGLALSYTVVFGMFALILNLVFSQVFAWGSNLERMLDLINGDIPSESISVIGLNKEPVSTKVVSKSENATFEIQRGDLEFINVKLQYRNDMPIVLQDLSVHISGGTRVGVIGRTGAGKSSLIVALFRLVSQPCLSGKILVDGFDTVAVNLTKLRKALAMIPQDPVLMGGSVRFNLDPFHEFQDADLSKALRAAHLPQLRLEESVGADGSLSAGERQLLCFARVLLLQRKILVCDEPTASIDMQTDALVQALLRESFVGVTLLTVAHRLHTIMDYDRILVMEAGRLKEDGAPDKLLASPGSLLAEYAKAANKGSNEVFEELDPKETICGM